MLGKKLLILRAVSQNKQLQKRIQRNMKKGFNEFFGQKSPGQKFKVTSFTPPFNLTVPDFFPFMT